MKPYYLSIFFALLLLTACGPEPVYEAESYYTIHNKSGVQVDLKVFDFSDNYFFEPLIDTVFSIPPNEKIEMYYAQNPHPTFGALGKVDSLYVIFAKKDSVFYTREDTSGRNPILRKNYSGGLAESDKRKIFHKEIFRFEYIITQQDYQNAVKRNLAR